MRIISISSNSKVLLFDYDFVNVYLDIEMEKSEEVSVS